MALSWPLVFRVAVLIGAMVVGFALMQAASSAAMVWRIRTCSNICGISTVYYAGERCECYGR